MRSIVNASEVNDCLFRVTVQDDNGTWVDISDRMFDISYGDRIDTDGARLSLKFRNHQDFVQDGKGLDPLDSSSTYNSPTALLGGNHDIKVEISKDNGSNYYEVYHGIIGPTGVEVSTEVSMDDVVTVTPDDLSVPYKEYYFYQSLIYKDALATSIMSQIFADHGFNQTVTVIDEPGLMISEIRTGKTSVWEAQKKLIEPTGYIYRIKWYNGEFRPCVYDPVRTKSTPDKIYSGTFSYRRVNISEANIRTQVVVIYRDKTSGAIDYAQAEDDEARLKYGIKNGMGERLHKTMWLAMDSTGSMGYLIDTSEEAFDMATNALHDVSGPSMDVEVRLPYIDPSIELHDMLAFIGNDYTINVGVTGISWSASSDNQIGQTVISGTIDRVIGGINMWLQHDANSPDVRREIALQYLYGDGKPPARPSAPTCYSYRGVDPSTGQSTSIVACSVEPSHEWDLAYYEWTYWLDDENEVVKVTTKDPFIKIRNLPIGSKLNIYVQAVDFSYKAT